MRGIRNWPIRRKLSFIIMLMSCVTLLLAWCAITAYGWFSDRQKGVRDLSIITDVIGTNTAAALAFDDPQFAEGLLAGLGAEPQIVHACVFDVKGRVFASYRGGEADSAFEFPAAEAEGHRFVDGHLILFRNVSLQSERLGTLYMRSDLREPLQQRRTMFAPI